MRFLRTRFNECWLALSQWGLVQGGESEYFAPVFAKIHVYREKKLLKIDKNSKKLPEDHLNTFSCSACMNRYCTIFSNSFFVSKTRKQGAFCLSLSLSLSVCLSD